MNLIKRVKRKQSGMIASNAYDMSPLVKFLGEVAKAFPNEFERKIRKSEVQKLGLFLEKGSPAEIEPEVPAVAAKPIKQGRRLVLPPRPKRAINLDD